MFMMQPLYALLSIATMAFIYLEGPLTLATHQEAQQILGRLIGQTQISHAGIYVDTITSG
jgi:hypothetical protein